MNENQLSRYGAISKVLPLMNPGAKVFFVGPTSSNWYSDFLYKFPNDAEGGTRVFPTISAAISDSNVVSGRGDVILVLPGYTETITAAGGLTLNKADVSLIGIGTGDARPTINFTTATTADLNVDEDNITIENFYFDLTGIDALAAPIDVNKINFVLRNCEFLTADSGGQATLGILTDANASGLVIENCKFIGSSNAGTSTVVRIVGGSGHVIKGSYFRGAYTTTLGAIENNTTACTDVIIEDNFIQNTTASSTKAIVFDSGSTGVIRKNHMQILSGTAPITGAAMSWVGANYYAATIATAGTLI